MSLEDAFFGHCRECNNTRAYNVMHGMCQSCTWGWIKGELPPAMPFTKGDKVQAFGNTGTVKSISVNGLFVEVAFEESPTTVIFLIDGRIHSWNNSPSLVKL